MESQRLIELEKKELNALKEFLDILKAEKEAIVSFSLDGIISQNNRKEEVLKKLEIIESEKARALSGVTIRQSLMDDEDYRSTKLLIEGKVKEVKTALQKNMGLLSFSVDHVKSSIDRIMSFINSSTYGRKSEQKPLLLSKVI
jgi:flagellar biosynthesis/type III secretory pathway chaperone